jgi:tetratricopeptide (TPR) repeat protein
VKLNSILVFLFSALLLFPGETTGLRSIKTGDKIPDHAVLNVFHSPESPGNKLILYYKSNEIKSITFLKKLISVLQDKEKNLKNVTLFLVDGNNGSDAKVTGLLKSIKLPTRVIDDSSRDIYGALGVIIVPTLILVKEDHTLHSLVAGLHKNLGMFIGGYLEALISGNAPENVYKAANRDIKGRKIVKLLNQSFFLMMNRNYSLANIMYKKALELDPQHLDAFLGTGYSLFFMGNLQESYTLFDKYKNENNHKRVQLGYYLCQAKKDPSDENLRALAQFAKLEPNFFMVVHEAAAILDKAGKCELSNAVYRHSYRVLLRKVRRSKTK